MLKIKNSAGMITLVIMLAFQTTGLCQKYDYNWIINSPYPDTVNLVTFKNSEVNNKPLLQNTQYRVSTSNITMSHKQGSLQFATNGCYIIGPDLQTMENGGRLNPNA